MYIYRSAFHRDNPTKCPSCSGPLNGGRRRTESGNLYFDAQCQNHGCETKHIQWVLVSPDTSGLPRMENLPENEITTSFFEVVPAYGSDGSEPFGLIFMDDELREKVYSLERQVKEHPWIKEITTTHVEMALASLCQDTQSSYDLYRGIMVWWECLMVFKEQNFDTEACRRQATDLVRNLFFQQVGDRPTEEVERATLSKQVEAWLNG